MSNTTPAFLTGSRVYGIPREDSDIDMVILVSENDSETLKNISDTGKYPIQFASLNLILVKNQEEYNRWLLAMRRCLINKPVDRDTAILIHKQVGITTKVHLSGRL